MGVHNLSDSASFKSSVLNPGDSNQVVVVDFFATWCGPCKVIAPKVVEMSNESEFSGVEFYKVDVDELSDVAAEQSVRAMPTFLIYKGGKKVGEVVGANQAALRAEVKKATTA